MRCDAMLKGASSLVDFNHVEEEKSEKINQKKGNRFGRVAKTKEKRENYGSSL